MLGQHETAVAERKRTTLDVVRALISSDFGQWGPEVEITQNKIDDFGRVTGDNQWIHTDPVRAASGQFGSTIAQGFLTLSLLAIMEKAEMQRLEAQTGTGLVHVGGTYKFKRPVRVESKIHSRSRLVSASEKHGVIFMTYDYEIALVGGKAVACGTMELTLS